MGTKNSQIFRTWAYGFLLPLVYLIVEFSFNHQLVQVLDEIVSDDILNGFEFWGRLISGIGLGILLYRVLTFRVGNTFVGLLVMLSVGVFVMWNAQKTLLDYLVESANPEDKRASIALAQIAPNAGEQGLQTLAGERLLLSAVTGAEKNLVLAIFPAAALHAENREVQLAQWLRSSSVAVNPDQFSVQVANNAYKNLIVPPVVIGFSIFFALVNLSIVISFLVGQYRPQIRMLSFMGCLVIFMGLSLSQENVFLDSEGYQKSLRPGLWHAKPALALLVEWSLHATASWGDVSKVIHTRLMAGYEFRPLY